MKLQTKILYLTVALTLVTQIFIYQSLLTTPEITQSQLILTIQTNKPSYQQGEVVKIFGAVMDSSTEPIANATISLEVKNPHNNTIFLDIISSSSNGTYEDSFRLHNHTAIREYHVYATANAIGYPTTMNQTTFLVNPIGVHDIAVTSVMRFKTVVGQGYCLSINVTVENQGYFTESFNVSVFYDNTIIILPDGKNHTTTTLPSGNSTTLTFTWNTTGVAKGNYTITAEAIQVPGETDTTDNTLTDGWVVVTIPGDINGDYKVNHKDLLLLASAYGSECGDPRYIPEADINCDCKVDHKDLLILASNYGKEDP